MIMLVSVYFERYLKLYWQTVLSSYWTITDLSHSQFHKKKRWTSPLYCNRLHIVRNLGYDTSSRRWKTVSFMLPLFNCYCWTSITMESIHLSLVLSPLNTKGRTQTRPLSCGFDSSVGRALVTQRSWVRILFKA